MTGNNIKKRAFIFMGGKNFFPEFLTDIPCENDLVIAADSGLYALSLFCEKVKKISPDIIVGDMDSFEEKSLSKNFFDAEFIKFPPEKDDTDTSLAVDVALSKGYNEIFILGGMGGRFDHTLAVAYLAEYIAEKGASGVISDGKNRVYLAKSKNVIQTKRKYVSLIPIDSEIFGVYFSGFKYPLENKNLSRKKFLTISNELSKERGEITIESGKALIVETMD